MRTPAWSIRNSLAGLLGGGAGSVILQALGLFAGSGAAAGGADLFKAGSRRLRAVP